MVERLPSSSLPNGERTEASVWCRPCLRAVGKKRCENLFQEDNLAVKGKENSGIRDGGKPWFPPRPKEGLKQYCRAINISYRHLRRIVIWENSRKIDS